MKKSLIFIAFFIFLSSFVAAAPVLFFSDLTSGPKTGWEGSATKGAAVTVWGLNLGSSRGTSYVTVGGVDLVSDSDYAEWGVTDNNAKIDAANTQQRITFWLNSAMITGSTTITVTIDGVTSNALDFTVRNLGSNHIYFIDDDGPNGNGLTVANAWVDLEDSDPEENSAVIPGDIVYIKDGTYNTIDGDGAALKLYGTNDGTSSFPYAFVGYPGERPIFTVPIMTDVNHNDGGTQINYYTFAKLGYTGPQRGLFHFNGDGWRLINIYMDMSQCTSQFKSGTFKDWDGDEHRFYGNVFKGGGYDYYAHHIYGTCGFASSSGGDLSNVYIAWNEVDDWENDAGSYDGGAAWNFRRNSAGAFTVNNVFIFNNYMHDSAAAQFFYSEESGTKEVYIYNNLMTNSNYYGTSSATAMIFAGFGSSSIINNFYVFNNIFYECGGANYALEARTGCTFYSKNNIFYQTSGAYLRSNTGTGANIYSANDLFYGVGRPPTGGYYSYENTLTSDPQFVNPSSGNFQLQSTSPAIDVGTSSVYSIVATDFLGIPRPQDGDDSGTAEYDIGAYEYISGTVSPVCGNSDVETGEHCDDGNIVTETCAYGQTSCVVCSSTCQNVSGATSYCGDGTCDTVNENSTSCSTDCGSASTCSSGADLPPYDNSVSIGELITYMTQWEAGTVSIGDLITAIDEWKNGC